MLAIVGTKKHGKTTLTVRLAAELKRRGHRVMTIKHGTHTFNIDPSTTDTYRHYHEGGAEKVAMVSPDKFALVERWAEERGPEAIVDEHMRDADIVLCEGFKRTALPRVEIFRKEVGERPLYSAETAPLYRAIVTDDETIAFPGARTILLSDPEWLADLATLVERDVMHAPSPGKRGKREAGSGDA
jgi:molybdopterin-guanine dinucleotide biosynthesis protein B